MLVFHVTDGIVPKIKCRRSGNALASCPPCLINKRSLSDKWTSYLLFLFFLKSTNSWKLTGIVTLWSMWQKKEKVVKLLLHDVSANVLYKPDCDGVFACRSLLPLTHDRRAVVLQESFRLGWEGRSVFLKGIANCFFLGHNDDATVEGHGTNMR